MKKIIVIATALILFVTINSHAQIGFKGQIAISASAGYTNLRGLIANARIAGYVSPQSVIGGEMLYNHCAYNTSANDTFKVSQVFAGAFYQYPLNLKRITIAPAAGILFGGEMCDKKTALGNTVKYNNKFVFAFSASIPIEYIFGNHWALYLEPRIMYVPNTNFDHLILSASIGAKYYF